MIKPQQSTSFVPQARVDDASSGDEEAERRDDWAAEIALTVAATMEPSCAFAFCFAWPRVKEKCHPTPGSENAQSV